MSIPWSTLRTSIALKLNDSTLQRYSADLLLECANDALLAYAATHTGVASDFSITGDGETYTYDLPGDIVDAGNAGVYAVQIPYQEWLREEKYWPGVRWPSTSRSTTSKPNAYVLWPTGKISFTQIPGTDAAITVHYVAYYPVIVDTDTAITVPVWAREAIKLYAAAAALEPASTKAGQLGQYKSRFESGKPEDNPLLRLSEHYMHRYYRLLQAHPVPQYRLLHSLERYNG